MSAERPPSAGNTDYKRWAERLNSYLVRTRSQLAYYVAGQTASEDGVLLWDADNSRLLVSSAGNWVPVAGSGGGGGTITNYLRDDADDSTNFRLTMAGLTVDTNTLYVDSTNNEVGIGTTNPSEKLEVVGNVEATEFIGDLRGAVVFKAQAGEALTKGDVVYISGISGQTTVVSKADANDAAKMPAFGLAAKDSSINTNLEVYTFGTLSGIDTSTFTEGDELFVGTTAGQLTDTPPTGESSSVQKIGKVTRSHASSGSIKIMGAGRTNATPNLNDGNIFIGDSNNQAVTTSLATQVSTLETSHSDVVVDGDFTSEGLMKRDATSGSYSIVTDNSSNWNTAHGWGNHASAGYLTAEANDLSTTVTWANVPDANITESSVTQHQSAINSGVSITESQISDLGTYLTASDITGKANLSGATFTGNVAVGLPPSGTQSLTVAGATNLYGGADLQSTNITDVDTLTAKNVNITHTGNASVTTNIATGGGITGNTKVLNLGTGYGFGGTTTVNIGSSTPNSVNTINLNGNVSLGGTFNGHPEEMMRGIDVYHYYDDLSHQSGGNYYLNNTLTEYGNPFQFKTYTNGATRQLKISIEVSYFDVNSTNDCQIGLRVSPSSASALSMGSVISVTSPATYTRDIEVGGDYTKYLSKISAIANTSNGVQTLPIYKYYYNVFTSRTIIKVGVYGISAANIPSAGDTLYVHPFGWDASAQDIVRSIDAYNALGVVNNTVEQTFFLGTYTVRNSVRFIARETTTSENVSIDNLYGIFTDTGA